MNSTLKYLLEQLDKYLIEPKPVCERLITSGRHFTGWLNDRLQSNQQVLINGIICSSSVIQDRLRIILIQIEEEFEGIATVKSLPYPFDDLDQMKMVIEGLISHFNSPISAEEIIQTLGGSSSRMGGKQGYIILTIINTPIIV